MINTQIRMKAYTKPVIKDICLLMDGAVLADLSITDDEGGEQLTRRHDWEQSNDGFFYSGSFWEGSND